MIRILGKKKVARRIFWGLAVVIIPSFIIWGVGTQVRSERETMAAKVNRQAISRDDYFGRLQEILAQYRQISKTEPAENSPEMANIKKAAIEDLIRQTLLNQEIKRRHIRVTDQEVVAAIKRDPAFLDQKGVFDENRFREIASSISDEEWVKMENDVRRRLELSKLQNLVVSGAQLNVSDQELAEYRKKYSIKPEVSDDIVRRLILNQKAGQAFDDWYQQIRKKARVEIYV